MMIERSCGFLCDLAHDGEEAYKMIFEKSKCLVCKAYRLVLIDINMPVMNGIELIKKLREAEKRKELKLSRSYMVVHTALPKDSFEDYKTLGFNGFLDKPLSAKKMNKVLVKLKLK